MHVEVAEVYSPSRMTKMADMMGMKSGFALAFTTNDENSKPWDFSIPERRRAVLKGQDNTKPKMLLASPPCTMFSALQNINMRKMTAEDVKRRVDDAVTHFAFAVLMCMRQAQSGRLFTIEHPVAASSWTLRIAGLLLRCPNARKVNFDFCMLVMKVKDAEGTAPTRKRTSVITNSTAVAEALENHQCDGAQTCVARMRPSESM